VGKIPNTPGVHGVALAPELGRGFTSNGSASTATIFNLKTLQVLGQVKTGLNPDAIVYDPFSRHVFTFNGKSNSVTVFDANSAKVVGTIPLNGKPEFAIADGLGRIYVNLESTSEVLTLSNRLSIEARSPLAPCSQPTGMAMDRQHRLLFIGCRNRMMAVVDANSGQIKTTLPIGGGVDAIAFDPTTQLAFSSNGEGTLTVVHEDSKDKFSVVDSVVTQRGARTMALDLKTHNVFLATARFGPTPTPTPGQPFVRPSIIPGTFVILTLGE
jgi:YVTN family beta-propeller protein